MIHGTDTGIVSGAFFGVIIFFLCAPSQPFRLLYDHHIFKNLGTPANAYPESSVIIV